MKRRGAELPRQMQKPELCAGEVDDWGDLPRPPPEHANTSGAEIHQSFLMPGLHQLGKAHIIMQSWAGIRCYRDISSGMEPPPLHFHTRFVYLLILGYLSWNKHKRNVHHTQGPQSPAALGDHTMLPTMCCPLSL